MLVRRCFRIAIVLIAIFSLFPASLAGFIAYVCGDLQHAGLPEIIIFPLTVFTLSVLTPKYTFRTPGRMFGVLMLGLSLSGTSVYAADGPAGPGWLNVQGPSVTPEAAEAYYESVVQARGESIAPATALPAVATTVTPEISALARSLKNDPKLIYEYVRNNIEYVPYFGSLKGATLTYLDGSGNDFDQASLMVSLLRASGFDTQSAQYVYGTMSIPTANDPNQKDMQHWLGVAANNSVIAQLLGNGGIPGSAAGANWSVKRVWVQVTIAGVNYLFDPAFKPHIATQSVDLKTAMGYSKSALLAAASGTSGTDFVQNLNEAGLKSALDGYTLNLANYLRTNYPNAKTSEIIGGNIIVPQTLSSLPTSLDFSTSPPYSNWSDIPDIYLHKVRIVHGGIDQTLNIADLAGQKLSIVYRVGSDSGTLARAIPAALSAGNPQAEATPPYATSAAIQPVSFVPATDLDVALPSRILPAKSINADNFTGKSALASAPVDFGSIYPASAGVSADTITWSLTNTNAVAVQIVSSLTSNPYNAYSITTGAGTTTLAPNQSMSVVVKFSNSGQTAGTKTGQLKILWQQTNGTIIGTPSSLDLTGYVATAMSLGNSGVLNVQAILNTPNTGTALISNGGSLPLTITAKTLTGSGAAHFQFVSSSDSVATTIPAGGSQNVQIKYLADLHGTQTAYVHLGFTYDGMVYSAADFLPLQGQSFNASNVASSYGFDYGTSYLNFPVNGTVRLVNAGTQSLSFTSASLTGADSSRFTVTGGSSAGTIAAGQYRDINVRYLADALGTHAANVHVSFSYDGLSQTIDLKLSGVTSSAPIAQLWLDDQMLAEEADPTPGIDLKKMTISVTHPYTTASANQSTPDYMLQRGSSYAIVYDFGGSRLGRLVEKRERQMQSYRETGFTDSSRQVLTESLNVIGLSWMRDTTLNSKLQAQLAGVIDLQQHRFGVVAQESGYYIDVKVQLSSPTSITGDAAAASAYFNAGKFLDSAMEHGVLEQMQSNSPSVSTVKLLQLNNSVGKKVFWVTSANFAAIKQQLSNYSDQDLNVFQASVSAGNTLILPENGKIALQSWSGKGYIDFSTTGASPHVAMIIGGGYNGGYGAIEAPVNIPQVSTQVSIGLIPEVNDCKALCNDPVNMATGIWEYSSSDLALSGGMGGLAFKRSYNSGNNNQKDSLGYGWSHNYRLYVEPHSSSPIGLGQRQPLDAVALIAASVATQDVMSGTPDLNAWVTGSLIGKWEMDNLTNNAASIHLETDVRTFIKLPDGSYSPPPGVTAQLSLSGGLYRVNERFNRTINFDSSKNASSITDADGNTVSFSYSAGMLQKVVNSFGHAINFVYTGNLLTSVNDSGSRAVSFGYDPAGNNLVTYTDPEAKVWTYGYDGNHQVLTIENPLGVTVVTNVYDPFGRIQTQTMPTQSGSTTHNLYFSGYRNMDEDGLGHQSVFYFDDQQHILGIENALGQKSVKNYDGQNHVISETDPRNNTTSYLFDGSSNLTKITDPFAKSTINSYDSLFRLTDVSDPLEHLTHTDFDAKHHPLKTTVYPAAGKLVFTQTSYYPNGLVNTSTDGRNVVTTLTQDTSGNPASSKTSTAPAITYVYDAIGRMTSLTDQEGAKTQFSYDKRSLLTGSIDPLNKATSLIYYDDGTLWKLTDRNNKTTTFSYTPLGKPDTVIYSGGSKVSYSYDQAENRTQMLDPNGPTTYAYDAANRLSGSSDPRDFGISYARDASGNITKITYPGNKTVSYTYDALNRVKMVTIDWLTRSASYNYDAAGRLTDLTQFNGTYAQYTYDNANRLTGLDNRLSNAGSAIATYTYTLDGNGNRTDVTQTVPLGLNVAAANATFTMNAKKNRLTQAGTVALTYDSEGQLATKAGDSYSFDDAHRVTGIAGSVSYQYKYDGSGNRLEATRNGVITRYIYDAGGNLLAEADGSNTIQKYYIYGNGLLGVVTSSGGYYCYHFDGNGNTVALTDSSANVANKYAYAPFGAIANQQEVLSQPFKYVGKFGVISEPNGLYYMKARYYDAGVGRFISEDPTGFGGRDVNLMAYSSNNPITFIDPQGEMTLCSQLNQLIDSPIGQYTQRAATIYNAMPKVGTALNITKNTIINLKTPTENFPYQNSMMIPATAQQPLPYIFKPQMVP